MAVPKPRPPQVSARPTNTGTDRLRRVLSMKGATAEAAGRVVDVLSPEVARSMASGSPESRAILEQVWQTMNDQQKEVLVKKIAEAFPNPRGNTGLSIDAERVIRAAQGKLTPEELASVDAGTGSARDGVFDDVAPDDVQQPPQLSRLPVPEGFDPKAKRVKDASKSSSKLEERPQLRSPDKTAELVDVGDGKKRVVMNVEEGTGRIGPQDIGGDKAGKRYGDAVEANVQMQREALLGLFGDQDGISAAIKRVEDGDQEVAAQFQAIRNAADKAHPIPSKPYTVDDGPARASIRNPQQDYNESVFRAVEGRTNSPVHQLKPGTHDTMASLLDNILIRSGKKADGEPLAPVVMRLFSSPEEAARMIMRNADPAMFDVMPATPSQFQGAKNLLGDLGITSQASANQVLGVFEPDLPFGQQPRQVKLTQAEEAIARQLRQRFGDQWGENYQPLPASDLEPAPNMRLPEPGPGTSQDLADIPPAMEGRTNVPGEKPVQPRGTDYSQPEPQQGNIDLDDPDLAEITQQGIDADSMKAERQLAELQRLEETVNNGELPIKSGFREDIPVPNQKKSYSQLTPTEQWQSQYGGKPKDRAWEDWMVDYNNLNRDITKPDPVNVPDGDRAVLNPDYPTSKETAHEVRQYARDGEAGQAQRLRTAEELAGTMDFPVTRPAADIRRDIDKVQQFMHEPSRPLTVEEINRGDAKLQSLQAELSHAMRLDRQSGVLSDAKPKPNVDDINAQLDEAADPDAPAIRPKPARPNAVLTPEALKAKVDTFLEKSAGRSRGSAKFVAEGEALIKQAQALGDEASLSLADAVRGAVAGKLRKGGGTKAAPQAAPEKAPGDLEAGNPASTIDPLESAATPLDDNPSAASPDNRKPQEPAKPVEQEASAKVDQQKAPEDAEAKRPQQESSTIPDEKSQTPKDAPQFRTWGQIGRKALKYSAVGGGVLGGIAGINMLGVREDVDQPWGVDPNEPVGAADGPSGQLAEDDLALALMESQKKPATPEDRIRAVRARMPSLKINLNTQIPGSWNH